MFINALICCLVYIMIGAMLLGFLTKLSCSKKTNEFFEYASFDVGNLPSDAFTIVSLLFALFWPILLIVIMIVFPFVYIKYKADQIRKDKNN